MRAGLRAWIRDWIVRRGYYAYRIEHGEQVESRRYLDETTSFKVTDHPIRDKRPDTIFDHARQRDATLLPEGLEDTLAYAGELSPERVLEIGPKWGLHTLWMDEHLGPSELVLCELPRKIPETESWRDRIRCQHTWIYKSLLHADELLASEPFDLVLCLGVIYHNVEPVRMLNLLNRITKLNGTMLLESTIDKRPDAVIRLSYGDFTKMFPSVEALRIMLAWTGWRDVVQFGDYRPGSEEALFLCRKTHDVGPDFPEPHASLRWE